MLKDIANRLVTDAIAQIGQGSCNTIVPPRAIFSGRTYHESLNLLINTGTSNSLTLQ
jgi:hypothetical protein